MSLKKIVNEQQRGVNQVAEEEGGRLLSFQQRGFRGGQFHPQSTQVGEGRGCRREKAISLVLGLEKVDWQARSIPTTFLYSFVLRRLKTKTCISQTL